MNTIVLLSGLGTAAPVLDFEPLINLFTKESNKTKGDGKTNESFCMSYLKNVKKYKVDVLEGYHYLHWTQSENISKETNKFIDNL